MRLAHALALCIVVTLAGCATVGGPATEAGTETPAVESTAPATGPTAEPTATGTETPVPLDLPDGVDRAEVTPAWSLSSASRDAFEAARGADEWVELESSGPVETFNDLDYVYADGRVWVVGYTYGTPAYLVDTGNVSADERVVAYGNLSTEQRRLFDRVRTGSGCCPGPDQEGVELPGTVRYDDETYIVESGTRSFAHGAIDVDPYEPERTAAEE
ncbi:hypothetical protein C475_00822 [Halosimplex carlsbadense 2-9-1]|uniref:DUF7979 domain-containing protein n=1 Tax=Halosimplex carlsbadense 2-9-1 TaxID=797114 RepID=M0D5U3_9EURY|nr:hypothetical protein [Halosimplex carlsbadense]ELZ30233.1 hypothetical protein C475_00822 [Halosimplex carlsbadense 2-9-1]